MVGLKRRTKDSRELRSNNGFRSKDFSQFASPTTTGDSLEEVHDFIHARAACGEQFARQDYAAFDPLFLFHHANIDRLWAYWEALHKESSTFTGSYAGRSRFSTPAGTVITPESPLQPFFNKDGSFHTSTSVTETKAFGYSYQGLEYWNSSDTDLKLAATNLINKLYGPTNISTAARSLKQEQTTRFFLRIQLDEAEVEGPSWISVYLRGVLAGEMLVTSQPAAGVTHGGFTIDDAVQRAGFRNGANDTLLKAVQSSITVDITKEQGSPIPVTSIPSLKIELEEVPYFAASSVDDLPTFGVPQVEAVSVVEHSKP
ncbi:Tyrosinase [Purpureocillium lavendulum]|nr:Tyrosinase [Purpureocillium lavendulum]